MTAKKLACGGKGPCCHIGYSHRHCEHCDTVVATVTWVNPIYPYQWTGQSYRWVGTSTLAQQLNSNAIVAPMLSNRPHNEAHAG
jgi:hypothetical protein